MSSTEAEVPLRATADTERPTSELLHTETTPDGSRSEFRQATFPPGSSTGWHHHVGRQTGIVTAGTLTHVTATGSISRYGAGDVMVEETDLVHLGRNDGPDTVRLSYVAHVPPGGRLAIPDEDPLGGA